MTITVDMVRELREKSGARMMDCKEALAATDGNFENAFALIKQKNLDRGSKQDKPTSQGRIYAYEGPFGTDNAVSIGVMSSNTDFVADGEEFKSNLRRVVEYAHNQGLKTVEEILPFKASYETVTTKSIAEGIQELAGKLGEKIELTKFVRVEGDYGYYIHFDGKQGAVVELEGATGELAKKIGKDIAMHIVFAKPVCLSRKEVPGTEVDKENAIIMARLADDPKNAKKPPQIIAKIVTGQLDKFYSKSVLVDQPYYKEEKKTVATVLQELGVTVKKFVYFNVGSLEDTGWQYAAMPPLDPAPCQQCRNPEQKGVCTCSNSKKKGTA